MSALLLILADLFTAIFGWLADIANAITDNPIILIGFGTTLLFVTANFFLKLFHRN